MADTPPNVTVNIDVKLLADALRSLADAVRLNGMEMRNMQVDMQKQADAINALAVAMTAPRTLVMKDGKPVGVVVNER
jgi:hypothetical protein